MNRLRPFACRFVLIAGLLTCTAASAAAQGRLSGIVRDQEGNAIPGATVTGEHLTSTSTRAATTNNAGRFSVIGLNPGEWLIVIRADGFEAVQNRVDVARTSTTVQFTMKEDRFNPPAPTAGVLAGLTTNEIVGSLEEAERLFDRGEYDAAIDAYRSIIERAPALTSLSLQIGHAFREKQEPHEALAAYRTVLDADPSNVQARAAIDALGQAIR